MEDGREKEPRNWRVRVSAKTGAKENRGLERRKIDEEATRRGAVERRMLKTTPETNSRV